MEIYNQIEQYIPEMIDVRKKYEEYLKTNKILKTNVEKLCDYCVLLDNSFQWNRKARKYDFNQIDIATSLDKKYEDDLYRLDAIYDLLSSRLRRKQRNPDDCANFSAEAEHELYSVPDVEGCGINNHDSDWIMKYFPSADKMNESKSDEMKQVVRYALNVNPSIGLFKKLDALCLKHKAFFYKVIRENYDTRVDPIIIYASKNTQEEMLKDLLVAVKPYRRKDVYKALGYTNIDNVVFTADEIKKETVEKLACAPLDGDDVNKFSQIMEMKRSSDYKARDLISLRKDVFYSGDAYKRSLMCRLELYLGQDYRLSSGQFQAYKVLTDAYCAAKQQDKLRACKKIAHGIDERL